MKYRSEIDGLRAIAVVPVVLFHAGFAGFSGGYIGVDIFFVISGYLITTILLKEANGGGISLLRFYDRRIRRILPALFIVMCTSIPISWLTMSPNQLKDFSGSILSVLFFGSNFFFWRQDDYFGPRAEEMPLLHTWSLSVEEQFYIFFPLLIIATFAIMRRYVAFMIAIMTLVSFALAIWLQSRLEISAAAVFYLLPTRAWELGIGALCACYLMKNPQFGSDWLSGIGLALIAYSIFYFDKSTPTPSAYTLIPTFGTALIILFCVQGGRFHTMLSLRPMIWIGLLSYSLYLWHQPLFAFARIAVYGQPNFWHFAALTLLSVFLAYLTWRFVELPARHITSISKGYVFYSLGAGFLILALASVVELRFQFQSRTIFSAPKYALVEEPQRDPSWSSCMLTTRPGWNIANLCQYGDGKETIALLGNSHAGGFAISLSEYLKGSEFSVREYTASACGFVFSVSLVDAGKSRCHIWFDSVSTDILNRADITTVVIAFRLENSLPDDLQSLRSFVEFAIQAGKRVIIINQAPTLVEDIDYYRFRRLDEKLDSAARPLAEWQDIYLNVSNVLDALPEIVIILDISDIFCEEQTCYAVRDGVPLYFDDDHMSLQAAKLAMGRLADVIYFGNASR